MLKQLFPVLALLTIIHFQQAEGQQSLLPIYSKPMVFIDSLGNVVGTLPEGYKILNTKDGKHDGGFMRGLAGNTVPTNTMIPAKNFGTGNITFFDKTGQFIMNYGESFEGISPNINGFHFAKRVDRRSMLPRTYYHFLDSVGSRVFQYNGYYKADAFSEGFAAVNHKGWHYIDTKGQRYDIIDSSFTNITDVSSFYDGVSRIKIRKGRYESGDHFRFVFIDKKGNTILDTEDIFPNDYIGRMGNMSDSISRVIFLGEKGFTTWGETAYVKMDGEVIGRFDSLFRIKEFSNGFVPILVQTKTKKGFLNGEGFIMNTKGEKIGFGEDKEVIEILHIDDQFFWVYLKDKEDGKTNSGVFDAQKRKFIFANKHDIMGMKWDLISLRDSRSNRYYVLNYKTGEIVYDTDKSNLVFSNIEEALTYKDKVQKYVCFNSADVSKLGELQNLKELTLKKIDVAALPDNFEFPNLEKLKIDGLRNLEKLPDHIKNLKKLSLRDCTSADNLMSMVTGLTGLEELFIINFDISEEDKKKIIKMYPNAKVTIKGKKKYADSELQEVIFGF
jgi:hypothetical protein